jgi:multidrug efflux pump subunit AcrB
MEELSLWTGRLLDRLQSEGALSDVASDLQNQGLQAYVEIHRDQAARLGVSVAEIANALYSAFGQRQIATLFTQANQSPPWLRPIALFLLELETLKFGVGSKREVQHHEHRRDINFIP